MLVWGELCTGMVMSVEISFFQPGCSLPIWVSHMLLVSDTKLQRAHLIWIILKHRYNLPILHQYKNSYPEELSFKMTFEISGSYSELTSSIMLS